MFRGASSSSRSQFGAARCMNRATASGAWVRALWKSWRASAKRLRHESAIPRRSSSVGSEGCPAESSTSKAHWCCTRGTWMLGYVLAMALLGLCHAPQPGEKQAPVVQGVRVAGRGGQDFAVAAECLVSPTGVLQCKRPREKRIDADQASVLLKGCGAEDVLEAIKVLDVIADAGALGVGAGEKSCNSRAATGTAAAGRAGNCGAEAEKRRA